MKSMLKVLYTTRNSIDILYRIKLENILYRIKLENILYRIKLENAAFPPKIALFL